MEQVQIAQAKAHLSALLERVEAGGEIIIARWGKAIARQVPEPHQPKMAFAAGKLAAFALRGFRK